MTAVDLPDRCPDCRCSDCGGQLSEHAEDACGCKDCAMWPDTACTQFLPPERIAFLDEQLAPLLCAHLGASAARRCTAIAHAAHHALLDYDQARSTR